MLTSLSAQSDLLVDRRPRSYPPLGRRKGGISHDKAQKFLQLSLAAAVLMQLDHGWRQAANVVFVKFASRIKVFTNTLPWGSPAHWQLIPSLADVMTLVISRASHTKLYESLFVIQRLQWESHGHIRHDSYEWILHARWLLPQPAISAGPASGRNCPDPRPHQFDEVRSMSARTHDPLTGL